MSDRTSKVYDGIADKLAATYSSGVSNETTGFNCEAYDRVSVHVTVASIVSSGSVAVYVDYSTDNTTFSEAIVVNPATGGSSQVLQKTPTTAGTYKFDFPNAGKFFRVRIAWASGTSVAVTAVAVEAKS